MAKTKRSKTPAAEAATLVTPAPKAKAPKAKAQAQPAKPKAPKPQADPAVRAAVHAEVRALVEAEAARRLCLCGCKAQTPRAFFVPGHDAKLASALLNERKQAA